MDKHRLVQQYVERQKAYVPTYTKERPWNERPATRGDFGFDTPVLRPRVPVNRSQQAGSSKRAHETEPGPPPEGAPSATQDPPDEPRRKRKKASTPANIDHEQAARLADRRERKRKKRAIVDPPDQLEDSAPAAAPKKGRKNDQKAKKPAALALMYGFSATNVTQDRLTLKPAPALGVFSKGKASVKRRVTATKKSSSKNDVFSECAFLNKPTERVADHSKVDDDSDSSVSSVSNGPAPKATRIRNRVKKSRDKSAETTAPKKAPSASNRKTSESEVWDIELQSKLPSSARDVSSEFGANDSAPVVVDLRKAEWSASLEQHEAYCNEIRTRNLSVSRSPLPARSGVHDEPGIPPAASSIHPSHSASQVGHRVQPSESHRVTSKYFAKPVSAPQLVAPTSRTNDNLEVLDFQGPDQNVQDATTDAGAILRATPRLSVAQPAAGFRTRSDVVPLEPPSDGFEFPDPGAMDAQAILRTTSPINSLIGVAWPATEFRTQSPIVPLVFPSDCSAYGGRYAPHNVSPGPFAGRDHGYYFEPSVVESQGVECFHAQQDPRWDSEWCSPAGLAGYDVGYDFMQGYAPSAPGQDEAPVSAVEWMECTPGGTPLWESSLSGMTREDLGVYGSEGDDESICWDGEGAAEFSEGRALLLGLPEWQRRAGTSGLAQAEMDVANRLRDHWRRVRLS